MITNLSKTKFRPYSYKISSSVLDNASKTVPSSSGTLFVFAGANGSGKSTLIANLYLHSKLLSGLPYLNADTVARTKFAGDAEGEAKSTSAMFDTMGQFEENIAKNISFVYETVLSHPSKIEMVKAAIARGYNVVSVYVYTSSPEINISRVKSRASSGGHSVPEDKIVGRYYRSIELSKQLRALSNAYYIFDNSKERDVINFESQSQ